MNPTNGKRVIKSLLFIVALLLSANTFASTYYWVGGSGSWINASSWSLTSGGAGGAGVPTATDDVIFDTNSSPGNTAFIVSLISADYCNNITWAAGINPASQMQSVANVFWYINGNATFNVAAQTDAQKTWAGFNGSIRFLNAGTIDLQGLSFSAARAIEVFGDETFISAFGNPTNPASVVQLDNALNTGHVIAFKNAFYANTINLEQGTLTVDSFMLSNDFSVKSATATFQDSVQINNTFNVQAGTLVFNDKLISSLNEQYSSASIVHFNKGKYELNGQQVCVMNASNIMQSSKLYFAPHYNYSLESYLKVDPTSSIQADSTHIKFITSADSINAVIQFQGSAGNPSSFVGSTITLDSLYVLNFQTIGNRAYVNTTGTQIRVHGINSRNASTPNIISNFTAQSLTIDQVQVNSSTNTTTDLLNLSNLTLDSLITSRSTLYFNGLDTVNYFYAIQGNFLYFKGNSTSPYYSSTLGAIILNELHVDKSTTLSGWDQSHLGQVYVTDSAKVYLGQNVLCGPRTILQNLDFFMASNRADTTIVGNDVFIKNCNLRKASNVNAFVSPSDTLVTNSFSLPRLSSGGWVVDTVITSQTYYWVGAVPANVNDVNQYPQAINGNNWSITAADTLTHINTSGNTCVPSVTDSVVIPDSSYMFIPNASNVGTINITGFLVMNPLNSLYIHGSFYNNDTRTILPVNNLHFVSDVRDTNYIVAPKPFLDQIYDIGSGAPSITFQCPSSQTVFFGGDFDAQDNKFNGSSIIHFITGNYQFEGNNLSISDSTAMTIDNGVTTNFKNSSIKFHDHFTFNYNYSAGCGLPDSIYSILPDSLCTQGSYFNYTLPTGINDTTAYIRNLGMFKGSLYSGTIGHIETNLLSTGLTTGVHIVKLSELKNSKYNTTNLVNPYYLRAIYVQGTVLIDTIYSEIDLLTRGTGSEIISNQVHVRGGNAINLSYTSGSQDQLTINTQDGLIGGGCMEGYVSISYIKVNSVFPQNVSYMYPIYGIGTNYSQVTILAGSAPFNFSQGSLNTITRELYWYGGSGNFYDNTHWSKVSGSMIDENGNNDPMVGNCPPTSYDNVHIQTPDIVQGDSIYVNAPINVRSFLMPAPVVMSFNTSTSSSMTVKNNLIIGDSAQMLTPGYSGNELYTLNVDSATGGDPDSSTIYVPSTNNFTINQVVFNQADSNKYVKLLGLGATVHNQITFTTGTFDLKMPYAKRLSVQSQIYFGSPRYNNVLHKYEYLPLTVRLNNTYIDQCYTNYGSIVFYMNQKFSFDAGNSTIVSDFYKTNYLYNIPDDSCKAPLRLNNVGIGYAESENMNSYLANDSDYIKVFSTAYSHNFYTGGTISNWTRIDTLIVDTTLSMSNIKSIGYAINTSAQYSNRNYMTLNTIDTIGTLVLQHGGAGITLNHSMQVDSIINNSDTIASMTFNNVQNIGTAWNLSYNASSHIDISSTDSIQRYVLAHGGSGQLSNINYIAYAEQNKDTAAAAANSLRLNHVSLDTFMMEGDLAAYSDTVNVHSVLDWAPGSHQQMSATNSYLVLANSADFTAQGTAAAPITWDLSSNFYLYHATIRKDSGEVCIDYVNMQNIHAIGNGSGSVGGDPNNDTIPARSFSPDLASSGRALFTFGANGIDGGYNAGWDVAPHAPNAHIDFQDVVACDTADTMVYVPIEVNSTLPFTLSYWHEYRGLATPDTIRVDTTLTSPDSLTGTGSVSDPYVYYAKVVKSTVYPEISFGITHIISNRCTDITTPLHELTTIGAGVNIAVVDESTRISLAQDSVWITYRIANVGQTEVDTVPVAMYRSEDDSFLSVSRVITPILPGDTTGYYTIAAGPIEGLGDFHAEIYINSAGGAVMGSQFGECSYSDNTYQSNQYRLHGHADTCLVIQGKSGEPLHVIENDQNIDSSFTGLKVFSILSSPLFGTATNQDSLIAYNAPTSSAITQDQLTYIVSDGFGRYDTVHVQILISAPSDTIVAYPFIWNFSDVALLNDSIAKDSAQVLAWTRDNINIPRSSILVDSTELSTIQTTPTSGLFPLTMSTPDGNSVTPHVVVTDDDTTTLVQNTAFMGAKFFHLSLTDAHTIFNLASARSLSSVWAIDFSTLPITQAPSYAIQADNRDLMAIQAAQRPGIYPLTMIYGTVSLTTKVTVTGVGTDTIIADPFAWKIDSLGSLSDSVMKQAAKVMAIDSLGNWVPQDSIAYDTTQYNTVVGTRLMQVRRMTFSMRSGKSVSVNVILNHSDTTTVDPKTGEAIGASNFQWDVANVDSLVASLVSNNTCAAVNAWDSLGNPIPNSQLTVDPTELSVIQLQRRSGIHPLSFTTPDGVKVTIQVTLLSGSPLGTVITNDFAWRLDSASYLDAATFLQQSAAIAFDANGVPIPSNQLTVDPLQLDTIQGATVKNVYVANVYSPTGASSDVDVVLSADSVSDFIPNVSYLGANNITYPLDQAYKLRAPLLRTLTGVWAINLTNHPIVPINSYSVVTSQADLFNITQANTPGIYPLTYTLGNSYITVLVTLTGSTVKHDSIINVDSITWELRDLPLLTDSIAKDSAHLVAKDTLGNLIPLDSITVDPLEMAFIHYTNAVGDYNLSFMTPDSTTANIIVHVISTPITNADVKLSFTVDAVPMELCDMDHCDLDQAYTDPLRMGVDTMKSHARLSLSVNETFNVNATISFTGMNGLYTASVADGSPMVLSPQGSIITIDRNKLNPDTTGYLTVSVTSPGRVDQIKLLFSNDFDKDGIPNYVERSSCTKQSNGIPNEWYFDAPYGDRDHDGIPNIVEAHNNMDSLYYIFSNGGCYPDFMNEDSNGDGVPDSVQKFTNDATDTSVLDIRVRPAITPNGDGLGDDHLYIERINKYPNNTVTIFDRVGRIIFKSTGYDNTNNTFDGFPNQGSNTNKKVPIGTYYYYVTYVDDLTKTQHDVSGFIEVVY